MSAISVAGHNEEARRDAWHEVQADSYMDYIHFGDSFGIINANWEDFKDLFPDQNWVKTRLDEPAKSRYAIMPGRILAPNEITPLEQYFNDWIKQVG